MSKNPKTPSLVIYLKPSVAKNLEEAQKVVARLEHGTLRKITSSACIYYSPDPKVAVVPEVCLNAMLSTASLSPILQ